MGFSWRKWCSNGSRFRRIQACQHHPYLDLARSTSGARYLGTRMWRGNTYIILVPYNTQKLVRIQWFILYKSIQYIPDVPVCYRLYKCEIMWVYRSVGKKVDWKGTNAWPHTPWAALLMDESPRSPVSLPSPRCGFTFQQHKSAPSNNHSTSRTWFIVGFLDYSSFQCVYAPNELGLLKKDMQEHVDTFMIIHAIQ